MRITTIFAAGIAALALAGTAAMADGHKQSFGEQDPKIYSYKTGHNFCPAGLEPATINGVICCEKPNAGMSYQQAKAHAVAKKRVHRVSSKVSCPVGTKGCTFD